MNYELFQSFPNKSIYLIDMKQEQGYFSQLLEQTIRKQLLTGKKILLLTNKVGYAAGLFCSSCGLVPQCKSCSVSVAYHQSENGLLYGICPVCKTLYDQPSLCPSCKSSSLQLYGLTTQKTKEWISNTFAQHSLLIQASDVSSFPKARKTLEEIKDHHIVIATYALVPPQTLAGFDVVVLLAADQSLSLPDYSVRERTFYNLLRSFQHFDAKFFLVQSFDTQHPSIRYACHNDEQHFLTLEQDFKQEHSYPPFGQLCIIKYNHQQETVLHQAIDNLYQQLSYLQQSYHYDQLEIHTSSPLIYKKFGKYYYHIVLKGPGLREFMDIAFSKLQMGKKGYKIDWMADSLL